MPVRKHPWLRSADVHGRSNNKPTGLQELAQNPPSAIPHSALQIPHWRNLD
jgi:hypothetical protein